MQDWLDCHLRLVGAMELHRMTLDDLDEKEQLALVALLRTIVQADGVLSYQERQSLAALAAELGERRFLEITKRAQEKLHDGSVSAVAPLVTRMEARRFIHARLTEVARSDGLVPSEVRRLTQLAELWDIDD
jgi:uncharacterized tellurite resistance protein B-like protein